MKSKEKPVYEPTPEEIRNACEEIRAGWTPVIERARYWAKSQPVEMDRPVEVVLSNGEPLDY